MWGYGPTKTGRGYISHKPNITPVYPFQDDGLKLEDIEEILHSSGVGMPPYTAWGRSRSGCFFCFYQQKIEWVHLKERHPDLFDAAKVYERPFEGSGNTFTWSERESLSELEQPERVQAIKDEHARRQAAKETRGANLTLAEVYRRRGAQEDVDDDACLICTL